MSADPDRKLVHLDVDHSVWDRFFTVAPLVIIGTREPDGKYDLAPKHMAMPLSWENDFGFVCTESHATYRNIRRENVFTVSFPCPDQVLFTSLAASPRYVGDSKPALKALPTFSAETVDGVFLQDGYLFLECRLDRIIDGFGQNSLIAGRIVATHLYRIAQEAINNAIKHGRAKGIDISLNGINESITLSILDNGVGIADKRSSGPGMGLRIM